MTDIVQKLWGFCHTLRHDGIDYGDYIEQITYLLFLKMADERAVELPASCDWPALRKQTGIDLTDHYIESLRTLGKESGILGDIFAGAQSRFTNPVSLKKTDLAQRRNRVDSARQGHQGRSIRGLARKSCKRGQKGSRPILHAAPAYPMHRAVHEARSARSPRFHNRRPRLRDGRIPCVRVRVAVEGDARRRF